MTGIYKITNLINGRIYIGQAQNINRRIYEHKIGKGINEQCVDKAIQKYGVDNFQFDVIEECTAELLNEREVYWINYYNSFFDGYNLTLGGQGVANREDKLTITDVEAIYQLLIDNELTQNEIAEKFKVSYQTISDINRGKTRILPGYQFPLRNKKEKINIPYIKKVYYCSCGAIISKDAKHCLECARKLQQKSERPEPITLAKEIIKDGFSATGRKYGVSDNAIRKWCKAYHIPTKKDELKIWLSEQ